MFLKPFEEPLGCGKKNLKSKRKKKKKKERKKKRSFKTKH